MDPALLNMLLPLLQGGNLNGMFGGQGMSGMLSELKNYSEQEQGAKASRLNVDPLRDIAPFRVNPFRGFMAKNGGSIDAASFQGGLPINNQFQMPSLGILPSGGIMGSIRNQIQQSAFQTMALGGMPEPDPSKLFKGSGDAYDVLMRYGLIPADTSREMFTQMYKPEDVKRIIMESKYAPKPGGQVIARRPITIAEEDTQVIETQIPQDTFDQAYAKARKKGLKTFDWEGMTYTTENDPNAKATSGKSASTTKTEIIKTRKEGNLRDFADGGTVDPDPKYYLDGLETPPKSKIKDRPKNQSNTEQILKAVGVNAALEGASKYSGFPGADTFYDLYNFSQAASEYDPFKMLTNEVGALIPGVSGKVLESIVDDYIPKFPDKSKKKMKFALTRSSGENAKIIDKYGKDPWSNPKFLKDYESEIQELQEGGTVDPGNPKPMAIDNTATAIPIDPNMLRKVQDGSIAQMIQSEPEMVELKDTRKVRATTGAKVNPNKDLVTGKYSKNIIENIIHKAKAQGVDPTTALAVALQETGLDNSMEGNVGHTIGKQDVFMGQDDVDNFISVLKDKTGRYSDKLGVSKDDEAMRLQAYNGFGKVVPSTESDYHGFNMKKIYGVPIPKEGLDMKKNPLYGKQILDLRDNVIKKNKSVMDIINKIEKSYKFLPSAQEPIKTIQGAKMGGAAGSLPSIPASIQLDTINNVPSNLPGGSGGKYDLSQLALQENERFMIPKMQPFTNPSFGNNMFDIQRQFQPNGFFQLGGQVTPDEIMDVLIVDDNDFTRSQLNSIQKFQKGGSVNSDLVYIPIQFSNGGPVEMYGIPKAGFGSFLKSIGRGIGKVAKGVWNGVKGVGDFALSSLGMPSIIDNTFVDKSKFLTGLTGTIGSLAPMAASFIPGLGTLASAGLGALQGMNLGAGNDNKGAPQQAPQMQAPLGQQSFGQGPQGYGGSMYNLINPFGPPPSAGMFQGQFSGGQGPFGGLFGGNPFGGMGQQGGMGNLMGMLGGFGSPMTGMQNFGGIGNAMGQIPFGSSFGTPMTGQQGGMQPIAGDNGQNQQLQMLMNLLQGGGPLKHGIYGHGKYGGSVNRYADGGEVQEQVELIPIQTEKVGKQSEMIIHLDGTITKVNATKRHKQMDEDEVTDIVPSGSYITSADPMMKIKFKTAEDIVLGIKSQPYKEWKKGTVPTEITLAEIWGSGKKDKTPAELTQNVAKRFNIIDKDPYYEHGGDIFTKRTNQENMEARIPFLSEIVRLNEKNKSSKQKGAVEMYRYGGSPLKLPNIEHAPLGWGDVTKWIGDNSDIISAAIPAVAGIFGGNKGQQGVGGISPEVQADILGTIPLYQSGVNQNIAAQQGALGQGIQDYSALGNQLINFARQSSQVQNQSNMMNTGLGMANYAAMETNLPQLDLGSARSRINNFQPRSASRAALEAQSTPNFDAGAIMSQMGARSGPLLAQLMSDQQRTANTAAIQRNQTLDNSDMMKMEQLNKLDLMEQPFNINQQEKERALREQQRSGMFGTAQSGIQRGADIQSGLLGQYGNIQSQILPTLTQFNMQRAGLEGQGMMLGSQNALNAFSVLGGMQSQNALANSMKQQQGAGATAGTGLPFQGGANPSSYGQALSGYLQTNPFSPFFGSQFGQQQTTSPTGNGGVGMSGEFGCSPGLCPDAGGMCVPC